MDYEYYILNVFSDQGIHGGNQLAVVPYAQNMDSETMQIITKEFNFSESTYVTGIYEDKAEVRIFTPGREIEYAGHPSIGTLYILEMLHRLKSNKMHGEYSLNLKGGIVKGLYKTGSKELGIVKFVQVPASIVGEFKDRQFVLDALGIGNEHLANDLPFYLISVTSMKFLFVNIKDIEILKSIVPNTKLLTSEPFKSEDINVYVFTGNGEDGGTVKARFFCPLYGIDEDPATGGIQSSFGLALLTHGLLENGVNEVIVEQGYEVGRPSKIYDDFIVEDGKLIKTITGGNCFVFSSGVLHV